MSWTYYLKKLWYKIIYLCFVIVYLVFLNGFNKELRACNFDSRFALLEYKDYCALKFFVMAALLFLIGCFMIYNEFAHLKRGLETIEDIIIAVLTIIMVIVLLLLIIKFIDNPILRAVLFAALTIAGAASAIGG